MTQPTDQHPAAAFYDPRPGAERGPEPPRDLTAYAVLAFATAAGATLFTCVSAVVLGRAARVRAEQGIDAVDWSLGVRYACTALAVLCLVAGWSRGSMWLYRARRNAEALAPGAHHARGAHWAWAGWLVPVVAFWFPFQVVRDVRRAITPRAGTGLVWMWFVPFLVTEVGWRIAFNLQSHALVRFEFAATAREVSVLVAAVMVTALAGWGQLLHAITVEQHQRMYAAAPAAPVPVTV